MVTAEQPEDESDQQSKTALMRSWGRTHRDVADICLGQFSDWSPLQIFLQTALKHFLCLTLQTCSARAETLKTRVILPTYWLLPRPPGPVCLAQDDPLHLDHQESARLHLHSISSIRLPPIVPPPASVFDLTVTFSWCSNSIRCPTFTCKPDSTF